MDTYELRYVNYSLTGDQEAVRDTFSDFFRKECPPERVRAAEPLGYDQKLWRQLTEMGAASMGLPKAAGGDGAGIIDLLLVAEAAGGALAPVPFAEHTAASRALAATGSAGTDLLREVAGGHRILTLALQPGDAWRQQLAPAAAVAQGVIVLDGSSLVLLDLPESPAPVPNQGSTPLAWLDLARGSRQTLADGPEALALHQRARAEWKLLTAAALTGLTDRALTLAVEFCKNRETLGVPIGALQGVAFPLTDVAIGVSGARHLIWRAGWSLQNDPSEARRLVPAASAYAAQVATHGTTTAAHAQGGLGFMVEADASLYFLRAKGWSLLGGDPANDVIAIADALAEDLLSRSTPAD